MKMKDTILCVDIGNTNIVFGLFKRGEYIHEVRISSQSLFPVSHYAVQLGNDFLENGISPHAIKGAAISSVVPSLTFLLKEVIRKWLTLEALVISPEVYPLLKTTTINPSEMGTDLMANSEAAFHKLQRGLVVVDFGTALTFTTLDDEAKILGVSIAPGLKTAVNALSTNTAQLPEIPLELPTSVLGKDTVHAIQAGILIGYCGMVEKMLDSIFLETGVLPVIATGGLSTILPPIKHRFLEIDGALTLKGIHLIWKAVEADKKR